MSNSRRLNHYQRVVAEFDDLEQIGRVTKIVGLTIESHGPAANIGDVCLFPLKTVVRSMVKLSVFVTSQSS